MANSKIAAETGELTANGSKLIEYSNELQTQLDTIKSAVDEIADGTFGDASPKLLDTYYALDKDLRQYVAVLDQLGQSVQASSQTLQDIDSTAASSLDYVG